MAIESNAPLDRRAMLTIHFLLNLRSSPSSSSRRASWHEKHQRPTTKRPDTVPLLQEPRIQVSHGPCGSEWLRATLRANNLQLAYVTQTARTCTTATLLWRHACNCCMLFRSHRARQQKIGRFASTNRGKRLKAAQFGAAKRSMLPDAGTTSEPRGSSVKVGSPRPTSPLGG